MATASRVFAQQTQHKRRPRKSYQHPQPPSPLILPQHSTQQQQQPSPHSNHHHQQHHSHNTQQHHQHHSNPFPSPLQQCPSTNHHSSTNHHYPISATDVQGAGTPAEPHAEIQGVNGVKGGGQCAERTDHSHTHAPRTSLGSRLDASPLSQHRSVTYAWGRESANGRQLWGRQLSTGHMSDAAHHSHHPHSPHHTLGRPVSMTLVASSGSMHATHPSPSQGCLLSRGSADPPPNTPHTPHNQHQHNQHTNHTPSYSLCQSSCNSGLDLVGEGKAVFSRNSQDEGAPRAVINSCPNVSTAANGDCREGEGDDGAAAAELLVQGAGSAAVEGGKLTHQHPDSCEGGNGAGRAAHNSHHSFRLGSPSLLLRGLRGLGGKARTMSTCSSGNLSATVAAGSVAAGVLQSVCFCSAFAVCICVLLCVFVGIPFLVCCATVCCVSVCASACTHHSVTSAQTTPILPHITHPQATQTA